MNSNEEKRTKWASRIEDYRSSGLTAAKWCESKGYKLSRLRYWINKFNKEKKNNESASRWVSVEVSKPVVSEASPIKVTIGKVSIEISSGFDPAAFEEVVRILSKKW
jgi:hypothetical protein